MTATAAEGRAPTGAGLLSSALACTALTRVAGGHRDPVLTCVPRCWV